MEEVDRCVSRVDRLIGYFRFLEEALRDWENASQNSEEEREIQGSVSSVMSQIEVCWTGLKKGVERNILSQN